MKSVEPVRSWRGPSADKRVHIIQGEYHVSSEHGVVISTVLGSCVAAAIRDPACGVGGMNHFLLPGESDEPLTRENGTYLMECLLNGLVRRGADKSRMEAKLFGGACIVPGLSDVGAMNAVFAERYLSAAGIPIVARSLGKLVADVGGDGNHGRRVEYRPTVGDARVQLISDSPNDTRPARPLSRRAG